MRIIGYVESISQEAIEGWAFDLDHRGEAMDLNLLLDGGIVSVFSCDQLRDDLGRFNAVHQPAGFKVSIPQEYKDGHNHRIEFQSLNGEQVTLATLRGTPQKFWDAHFFSEIAGSNFVGFVETFEDGHIVGWLNDILTDTPVSLNLIIDDQLVGAILCDKPRTDVRLAGAAKRDEVGFSFTIPSQFLDNEPHHLYFLSSDIKPIAFHVPSGLPKVVFEIRAPRFVAMGRVDGLLNGAVRGWALVHDRKSEKYLDSCQIVVSAGGQIIGQVTADILRTDVATKFQCGPSCGFAYVPPTDLCVGRSLRLTFKIVPYGLDVPGGPFLVEFLEGQSYAILQNLLDEVESLFTRTWQIRGLIKNLIPIQTYSVQNYNSWAMQYFAALASFANELPPETDQPLVSIICPVYKPRLMDFAAAVESVIVQTYKNWELIIVDDASESKELVNYVKSVCTTDKRIKFTPLKKNAGISQATNAAIKKSTGSYVVLFDHDDLLIPQAIQLMLHYATRTGAKLLYSDEDKIDDIGYLSEAHLKPNWNLRLLLSQNYVCHLLMLERKHMMATGLLRKEFDGAQDHDFILRLSEGLRREEIVHVPEILYHWRKTPSSTAASGGSKPYAISAGVRCIQDFLKRRGLDAEVISLQNSTIYEIKWAFSDQPSVTIIIPYREQIEMTRRCVHSLLNVTKYDNYEIFLVDNWSTSQEARDFAEEWTDHQRVKYLSVPERFNYSRINNIAAQNSVSEFLVFMNNDVITLEENWLRLMINEALADANVAIVGNKLLYPDGRVQHGGVVLGVGGIADHAHRLLEANDPGYMGRAICAQEITAVTAACMLCRKSVFDILGGFDEKELHVAYNDVDLCLRARAENYTIVWLPSSRAEHHESLSRGSDLVPSQQARFFHEHQILMNRWREVILQDPYYNEHFSRRFDIYSGLGDPKPIDTKAFVSPRAPK